MNLSKQVRADHYDFLRYVDIERWNSYWHQISEVLITNPKKVLVIGIGDGIVIDCLRKAGIDVKTLDMDSDVTPDYLGSVSNIADILNEKFDTILCAQVLEHLPYEYFESIISQLKDCLEKALVLSLPFSHVKIRIFNKTIFLMPKFYKPVKFKGQHYWQIGNKGYSKSMIENVLRNYFKVEKSFHVPVYPYHLFYILKK